MASTLSTLRAKTAPNPTLSSPATALSTVPGTGPGA